MKAPRVRLLGCGNLCQSGVTLLELLVVLALLAVVSVLIVPAMQRAARSAAIAQSTANLRALSRMAQFYLADHDGYLPSMRENGEQGTGTWDTALLGGVSGSSSSVLAARLDRFPRPPGTEARSYSLNPALAGRRPALLAAPSRCAMFIERHASLYGEPMAYVGGPPYRPTGYSDFPYEGKTQLAFADGSVAMVERMDWSAWHERYIFP